MPQDYPTPSEIERAKRQAVGGKRDRCVKGKSCSAACIAANEFCLVEIPDSVSAEIAKVRNSLNSEDNKKKTEQLKLFEPSKYVTKEGVRAVVEKFKQSNQEKILKAIEESSEEKYNKARQEAITFNKNLVKDGLAEKGQVLAKVPVSWEKHQKVTKAYNKAYDKVVTRAEEAAMMGDKKKYDKEERKLTAIQTRLGAKVGDTDKVEKGYIWKDFQGDFHANNFFLKGLRESPVLRAAKLIPDDVTDDGFRELKIVKKVGKHEVGMYLEDRATSFSFKINGSYDKPKGLSNAEGLQIAKVTEQLFSEVVKHMDEGSVVRVYPYGGDGRGAKRRRAYERFGFATSEGTGDMYGKVVNGTIRPASYVENREFRSSGDFNFVETGSNRALWMYTALWGEDPA